jgi:hypothetical protein
MVELKRFARADGGRMYGPGGKISLVEFSYVSKASPGLPAAVFLRLARQAWRHNTRMGLTGELRLRRGRFEQVLEGPGDLLLPLAGRILADPRHASISIRAFRPVEARRFAAFGLAGFEVAGQGRTKLAPAANLCFLPVPPRPSEHVRSRRATVLGTS